MGRRGNSAACSALGRLSDTSPTIHKQIGPFWCRFSGGWVCVRSRTLWVSPTKSPVMQGVSPATPTPTGFFQWEMYRLYFPVLEPWVTWSVLLPRCSSWFICTQMWDHLLHQLLPAPVLQLPPCRESSPPWLPNSTPPTGLDECFFLPSGSNH